MRNKRTLIGVLVLGLLAITLGACGGDVSEIQGIEWQWVSLVETSPAWQSLVPDSEDYTIVFKEDGELSIKADCNMVLGEYSTSGSQMTIEMGASTMAYCGEESSDNFYLGLLDQVATYELKDNDRLELGLAGDVATMGFQNGGEAK